MLVDALSVANYRTASREERSAVISGVVVFGSDTSGNRLALGGCLPDYFHSTTSIWLLAALINCKHDKSFELVFCKVPACGEYAILSGGRERAKVASSWKLLLAVRFSLG